MVDIASLKKSRSTDFSQLQAKVKEELTPVSYTDDRFWKLERDAAGNASATIRFLRSTEPDVPPYVEYSSYAFKGPSGNWYIERCLKTLKQPDPVYELNGRLYKSNNETDKLIARNQRLVTNYVSNILVVNDPKHPENNGKVFLFKYGNQIHKIITDKIAPTFEDEEPVNVFCYWDGANLKLRMKNGENNRPNYLSSAWENPAPIGPDEYIQTVASAQYNLSAEIAPNKFKTYDELKKRLDYVYSDSSLVTPAAKLGNAEIPFKAPKSAKNPATSSATGNSATSSATPAPTDDEDYEEYFNSLLDEN